MTVPSVPATNELPPSLVRTAVPMVVGPVVAYLVSKGFNIDSVLAQVALTSVFSYVYYAVARFLEVSVSDKWGYILGWKKQPVYTALAATVLSDQGAKVVESPEGEGAEEPLPPVDSDPAQPGLQVKAKTK